MGCAQPAGASKWGSTIDDLTEAVPTFELTMEPIEDQKDGAF